MDDQEILKRACKVFIDAASRQPVGSPEWDGAVMSLGAITEVAAALRIAAALERIAAAFYATDGTNVADSLDTLARIAAE